MIRLISVTVITDDSLVVQYASRNTRYDFLHHIRFKPALKDYETWFNISQTGLDYINTYYLSRKAGATGYTVSTMETTRKSISEYDARTIKEKYLECRSPFWVALEDLSFD